MAKKRSKPLRVPVAFTTYKLKANKRMKPLGLTKFHKKTLYINKDLKDVGQWSGTFWHEWLHAVSHEGGYERLCDNEAYIEYTAQAIMRMLADPVGGEMVRRMIKDLA